MISSCGVTESNKTFLYYAIEFTNTAVTDPDQKRRQQCHAMPRCTASTLQTNLWICYCTGWGLGNTGIVVHFSKKKGTSKSTLPKKKSTFLAKKKQKKHPFCKKTKKALLGQRKALSKQNVTKKQQST